MISKTSLLKKKIALSLVCTSTLATSVFLIGCGGSQPQHSKDLGVNAKYCDNSYFDDFKKKIENDDDTIFNGINAGTTARFCKKYELSNEFLNAAKNKYEELSSRSVASIVADKMKQLVGGQSFSNYEGSLYEAIMIDTMIGQNYLDLGNDEEARVSFNQASLLQDKARDVFKKQIETSKGLLEKAKERIPGIESQVNGALEQVNQAYDDNQDPNAIEYQANKDFVNPYTTYMLAMNRFLTNDYNRARDYLKELVRTYPKSKEFKKQLQYFETGMRGSKKIFVVYEDGRGATKESMGVAIPFSINGVATQPTIGFPVLKYNQSSYENVSVNDQKLEMVSNFDSVISAEFNNNKHSIIVTNIVSSALKSVLTGQAAEKASSLGGGLGGTLFGKASSALGADEVAINTRSWDTLPKKAYAVMMDNNGLVELKDANGKIIAKEEVDSGKNALVIVRSLNQNQPAITITTQR
ncbi:tetratricopeptide repeat protein [Helicobacter winghamensis]|uniref:Tetratricopeptide repeat protein n=1 Tax=Helicobacter winghamensis TaxID=157268 RepID=A0A2N3PIC7_9HELI|nr:tetratricopeptide repeat protein [Helicobacter winghamensis]PKT76036.1 hypothetical protein BCM32_07150 [Helicobacter winghamensis]PKT80546.1 hypothetical protein BCM31_03490 [Helicobacter winghamensis]PKT80915.1 hypothetical protein BCM33_07175 [Helicobacter winghamensis]